MTEEMKKALEKAKENVKKHAPENLDPKRIETMIRTIFNKEEA